jgi:predicted DNA repair protein MutK
MFWHLWSSFSSVQHKITARKNQADEQQRAEQAANAAEASSVEEEKKLAESIKVTRFDALSDYIIHVNISQVITPTRLKKVSITIFFGP